MQKKPHQIKLSVFIAAELPTHNSFISPGILKTTFFVSHLSFALYSHGNVKFCAFVAVSKGQQANAIIKTTELKLENWIPVDSASLFVYTAVTTLSNHL
jgi:hypothetical protein